MATGELHAAGPAAPPTPASLERVAASVLFCSTFLYIWVSLTPFPDLTYAQREAVTETASNTLNQAVVLLLVGALIAYAIVRPARHMILRPRVLLFLIFAWFAIASLQAADTAFALRRLTMALIVCVAASIVLTVPQDETHFARMLAGCTALVLLLCYAGVALAPRYSIHQVTDELEPMLAGDWRGLFEHKNTAGSAMVVIVFFGLYVSRVLGPLIGMPIVVLATVFLVFSGSKTSMAMLPVTLGLAFVVVRVRHLRAVAVVGTLATVMFFTIGSAVSEAIAGMVKAAGIDATFTDRTDIWKLAIEYIGQRPWTGYGYQSFWRGSELMSTFREDANWATVAADAHNGYLETLLTAGVPGFAMAMLFLIALPLRSIARAERNGAERRLTELFTRIWLFGLLAACLESILFYTTGEVWFSMLMAIFGLRLQATARLRPEQAA